MTSSAAGRRAGLVLVALIGAVGLAAVATGLVMMLTGSGQEGMASRPDGDAPAAASSAEIEPAPREPFEEREPVSRAPEPVTALVDTRWVERVSGGSGIPPRALAAYAGAAIAANQAYPGCRLGWNTLAAIGLVESDHGTYGGATLGEDGVAVPSIVGAALDGVSTARIPDTDQGRLDGDTVWDRAVGPMQFIPSTWQMYGSDGNGDGVRDPNQIDDAALAAAHYLCDVGGDLTVAANWISAVADYNPSAEYNNLVADAADAYAAYG